MKRAQIGLRLAAVTGLVAAAFFAASYVLDGGGGGVVSPSPFASVRAETASVDAGVRISAQRLDDGEVQFGLRARTRSGVWAEPVEPRVNSFNPANVSAGRWLTSSSLILEVDETGRGRLERPDMFESSGQVETRLVTEVDGWDGDIRYSAWNDADGDLITTVSIYSASAGSPDGELRTTITCQERDISVVIGGLSADTTPSDDNSSSIDVSWSVDRGAEIAESRATWPIEGGIELIPLEESGLGDALLGGGSMLALSLATNPPLHSSIDLNALSALPVYDNLTYCVSDEPLDDSQLGQTELRIQAQLRDDDRIEFAVQQRTDDGWSERILPRLRVMRAFGDPTNWLSSSAISVSVDVEPSHVIVSPDPVQRSVAAAINPILRSGWQTGTLQYSADLDVEGRLNSVVTAHSEEGLQLQIGCFNGARRVQLAGAASDASGAIALTIDDMQSEAIWRVVEDGDSNVLRPADAGRLLERLRVADTLAVTVDESTSATFSLSGLFETPIQANLDQCGNYTDQAWQPVVEAQEDPISGGAHYYVSYPDRNAGRRFTSVSIAATGDGVLGRGEPTRLHLNCDSGRNLNIHVSPLPIGAGEHTVRSRIDDGEWVEERWTTWDHDGEIYTNRAAIQGSYDRLRQAQTLVLEFPSTPAVRRSFDLTALFDTPVQTNIDNCGVPLWTQETNYVPILARGQTSAHVSYRVHVEESGGINSVVSNEVSLPGAFEDRLDFEIACFESGVQNVRFWWFKATEADTLDVTLEFDGGESETEPWELFDWNIDSDSWSGVDSHNPSRLIARLRGASSLKVTIHGANLPTTTFDVTGMFDTPIQENIDECGFYQPGETREPPPGLNTSGSTQGINGHETSIDWRRDQTASSVLSTLVWERVLSEQGAIPLLLMAGCGDEGVRLWLYGTRLAELSGDDARVEWSVDGAPAVIESWGLDHQGPFGILLPDDPQATIAAWRDGALLQLAIPGSQPISQRFDLGTMFSAPVMDTLDRCLTLPLRTWDAPVTDVGSTTEGNLTYGADQRYYSWPPTFLRLQVPSDAAPEWVGYSSQLHVSCGIEGIGIWISDIGLARSAYIADDTVEVTWRVGNGIPQTATWDAWQPPLGGGPTFSISPQDDAAFFAAINGADSLSISVGSDPVFTETYDFADNGFWDTPVQPNLDACGDS